MICVLARVCANVDHTTHNSRTCDWHFSHVAMPAPTLPPELIKYTIDLLDDDVEALRACARVHSAWAVPSQRRLFFHIKLLKPCHWRTLPALLEQSQHLRPLVRVLTIGSYSQAHYAPVRRFPTEEDLEYVQCSARRWTTVASVLLPAVRTLNIFGYLPVVWLMNAFPTLESLFIDEGPEFQEEFKLEDVQAARSIRLQSLSIALENCLWQDECVRPTFQWLTSTSSSESLHAVHLRFLMGRITAQAKSFILTYSSIRRLVLTVNIPCEIDPERVDFFGASTAGINRGEC
jgi:hypothetical protein